MRVAMLGGLSRPWAAWLAAVVLLLALAAAGPVAAAPIGKVKELGEVPDTKWVRDLAVGSDGQLWFPRRSSTPTQPSVGRMTLDGKFSEFTGDLAAATPGPMVLGPDGNLWMAISKVLGSVDSWLVSVTPSGTLTQFSMQNKQINFGGFIAGIDFTADGSVWIANDYGLARRSPEGEVQVFRSGLSAGAHIRDLVRGPDGNIWFTEAEGRLGYITPAGLITEFTRGLLPNSSPLQITRGPDGNLWFTDERLSQIGRITPSGVITQFPVWEPAEDIAAGPDGNLWFTRMNTTWIANITPEGLATRFQGINLSGEFVAHNITAGPDGNMYFSEDNVFSRSLARIARISSGQPRQPPAITGLAMPGGLLRCQQGFRSPSLYKIERQWLRDGQELAGATSERYSPAADDLGHRLSCRVTASFVAVTPKLTALSNVVKVSAHPEQFRLAQRVAHLRRGKVVLKFRCPVASAGCPEKRLRLLIRRGRQQVKVKFSVATTSSGLQTPVAVRLSARAQRLVRRGAQGRLLGLGAPKPIRIQPR